VALGVLGDPVCHRAVAEQHDDRTTIIGPL
jgi:hypothetical protein